MLEAFAKAALVVAVYMVLWFALAMAASRSDLVDIAWGLGFVVLSIAAIFWQSVPTVRMIVVAVLVSAWGLRLAGYLFVRNSQRDEDFRYAKWRREWGRWFAVRTFLQVFMLQGVFMVMIASPILVVSAAPARPIDTFDIAAISIWMFGFLFESVADGQMLRFKSNPLNKGRIMTTGLWELSRHPNYFGEVVQWWGIAMLAVTLENGIVALIGPATITFLLLRVSGIPMLERKWAGDSEFEEYKARTSVFLPLPPKR